MAKGFALSTALAIGTGFLTLSAIAGIVIMSIAYEMQIQNNPPTRPPPTTTTVPVPTGPPTNLRLPRNMIPESYIIFLMPHFYTQLTNQTTQSFLFTGNSTVTLTCLNKTRSIFLHSKDLDVTDVKLRHLNKNGTVPLKVNQYVNDSTVSETNFLEVRLDDEKDLLLENEKYMLIFSFTGMLLNDLSGFYASQYEVKETNGTSRRYLGVTQMAATEARKVFPCFDEPDLKATFHVTLVHREGTSALASWPQKDGTGFEIMINGEKWTVTEFKQTQKMSTYLVAFAVFDFNFRQQEKNFKVWARPEAINAGHADYAAQITPKILNFFEKEFGIDYTVSKLDQIALPDLAPTAMENWGLITYRESALLFAEGASSTFDKEYISTVIAHELAHQWFGNLVTMKWWNNLWLKEGFATFLSYQGLNDLQPSWNAEDLFVVNEVQSALQADALATSHPLCPSENDIETLGEINRLYDTITYSKGGAVLRMLSYHIGQTELQNGLKKYLQALQFETADQNDLWTYLQQAVHPDQKIKDFMSSWTEQAGYPVVSVNTNNGEISQKRFLLNGTGNTEVVWHVPISGQRSEDGKLVDFSLISTGPLVRSDLKSKKWILVNTNCTGFYRVNYNLENWQRLTNQLEINHHAFGPINRAQLIDDAFNMARANYVNVTVALDMTRYLTKESGYIPWASAIKNLDYFIFMFDRSEVYGPMQAYLQKQITPLYNHFKNDTDNNTVPMNHLEQYAQVEANSMACKVGLQDCISVAHNMFHQWKDNGTNEIHPNLKFNVYCYGIATGGEEEWEFAWETYMKSTIAAERDKLRYGLSCTKHIWLLNRYLHYTLDPSKIGKADIVSTITYIASNVAGQSLAWEFVRGNWNYFSEEFGGKIMSLESLIDGVTKRFSTEYELQQLKQFEGELNEYSTYMALEQAIERTQTNMKWVEENMGTILNWFKNQLKTSR